MEAKITARNLKQALMYIEFEIYWFGDRLVDCVQSSMRDHLVIVMEDGTAATIAKWAEMTIYINFEQRKSRL